MSLDFKDLEGEMMSPIQVLRRTRNMVVLSLPYSVLNATESENLRVSLRSLIAVQSVTISLRTPVTAKIDYAFAIDPANAAVREQMLDQLVQCIIEVLRSEVPRLNEQMSTWLTYRKSCREGLHRHGRPAASSRILLVSS